MNCEQARTMLTDCAMGEVTAAEKLEIRQHVEGCASCAEELERLQRTMTLLARAEVPEEVPQRIRLAAEPVSLWAAFWRSGARVAFAAAGLACLAIGLLAVSQVRITVGEESWEIAFGGASAAVPAQEVPGEASALLEAAAGGGLGREEIVRLVAEAVRASEARQQASVNNLVRTASEQVEQQRQEDLEELSESFRYIQAAQTMMWKDQVQSQEVVGALVQRVGLPVARP
jgi:anti-sigma factor RsiW